VIDISAPMVVTGVVIAGLIEINGIACGSTFLFALNVICYGYAIR